MSIFLDSNLRFLRKQKDVSQAQMQTDTGLKRTTISNWENGTSIPDISDLVILANYFGVKVDDLLLSDMENANPVGNIGKNKKTANANQNANQNAALLKENEDDEFYITGIPHVDDWRRMTIKRMEAQSQTIEALKIAVKSLQEQLKTQEALYSRPGNT